MSKRLKVNLANAMAMVSGGITKDGISNSLPIWVLQLENKG